MRNDKVEALPVEMGDGTGWMPRSALVRLTTDDGGVGPGEASPMMGGIASLGIVSRDCAPVLKDRDPLDHAVLVDALLHRPVRLGPEGAATAALAAIDVALWDIRARRWASRSTSSWAAPGARR